MFRPRLIQSNKRMNERTNDWQLILNEIHFQFFHAIDFFISFFLSLVFLISHHFFIALYPSLSLSFCMSVALCWLNIFLIREIASENNIEMQHILRHISFLFCKLFTAVEWWRVEMVLIMDIIYIFSKVQWGNWVSIFSEMHAHHWTNGWLDGWLNWTFCCFHMFFNGTMLSFHTKYASNISRAATEFPIICTEPKCIWFYSVNIHCSSSLSTIELIVLSRIYINQPIFTYGIRLQLDFCVVWNKKWSTTNSKGL